MALETNIFRYVIFLEKVELSVAKRPKNISEFFYVYNAQLEGKNKKIKIKISKLRKLIPFSLEKIQIVWASNYQVNLFHRYFQALRSWP